MQDLMENEDIIQEIDLEVIIEVLRLSTKARQKKNKVPEEFFNQLYSDTKKKERIFKIKAQALSMDEPYMSTSYLPGIKNPELYSEPISPQIPSQFKTQILKYAINGTEKQLRCEKCNAVGKFDCLTCSTTGKIRCITCSGMGQFTCTTCGGRGRQSCYGCGGSGRSRCSGCGGSGRVASYSSSSSSSGSYSSGTSYRSCSSCGGSGQKTCYSCHGSGQITCRSCSGSGRQTCNRCGGSGSIICSSCQGKGYTICSDCEGAGFIWEFTDLNFKFNYIEQNYITVDQDMQPIEQMVPELPDEGWTVITDDYLEVMEEASNTAKLSSSKIQNFNVDISDKDIKKRENQINVTNGVLITGNFKEVNYELIIMGQELNLIGSIQGLPVGLKLQKDGTQNSSDKQFYSMDYLKKLKKRIKKKEKLKRKQEKKKSKKKQKN